MNRTDRFGTQECRNNGAKVLVAATCWLAAEKERKLNISRRIPGFGNVNTRRKVLSALNFTYVRYSSISYVAQ